jgi:hypothetical protein
MTEVVCASSEPNNLLTLNLGEGVRVHGMGEGIVGVDQLDGEGLGHRVILERGQLETILAWLR